MTTWLPVDVCLLNSSRSVLVNSSNLYFLIFYRLGFRQFIVLELVLTFIYRVKSTIGCIVRISIHKRITFQNSVRVDNIYPILYPSNISHCTASTRTSSLSVYVIKHYVYTTDDHRLPVNPNQWGSGTDGRFRKTNGADRCVCN